MNREERLPARFAYLKVLAVAAAKNVIRLEAEAADRPIWTETDFSEEQEAEIADLAEKFYGIWKNADGKTVSEVKKEMRDLCPPCAKEYPIVNESALLERCHYCEIFLLSGNL